MECAIDSLLIDLVSSQIGKARSEKARMALPSCHRDYLKACLGALFAWALLANGAAAAPCDNPRPVQFPVGGAQAQITGGIARGELACWTVGGRRGQHMTVRQPANDHNNIVLQIYRPPWSVAHSPDGIRIHGRALPGTAEGQDATGWTGVLPATGSYLLVLGTTWGGGPYRVRIEIR